MKVCVTSTGEGLEALVDPRFGRCAVFVIVDTETLDFSAMGNASASASGGAGVQAAQTVARTGCGAVITGSIGPNAYAILSEAGVKIATGATGRVIDAVRAFKEGRLEIASAPTSEAHGGMRRRGGA